MSDYISLFPRLPRRRKNFISGDERIEQLEAALLEMTQRRDYLKELNEELIEKNKRLNELIDKTAEGLHEIASGGDPPPRARWWQRQCPFRWSGEGVWHTHDCRLMGSGYKHIHICDCGEINP